MGDTKAKTNEYEATIQKAFAFIEHTNFIMLERMASLKARRLTGIEKLKKNLESEPKNNEKKLRQLEKRRVSAEKSKKKIEIELGRWKKIRKIELGGKKSLAYGQITYTDGTPAEGLTVTAMDKKFGPDGHLNEEKTDEHGDFFITYTPEKSQSLYLVIISKNEEPISTKEDVRSNPGKREFFQITLKHEKPE